jgi:hypothetical protein
VDVPLTRSPFQPLSTLAVSWMLLVATSRMFILGVCLLSQSSRWGGDRWCLSAVRAWSLPALWHVLTHQTTSVCHSTPGPQVALRKRFVSQFGKLELFNDLVHTRQARRHAFSIVDFLPPDHPAAQVNDAAPYEDLDIQIRCRRVLLELAPDGLARPAERALSATTWSRRSLRSSDNAVMNAVVLDAYCAVDARRLVYLPVREGTDPRPTQENTQPA